MQLRIVHCLAWGRAIQQTYRISQYLILYVSQYVCSKSTIWEKCKSTICINVYSFHLRGEKKEIKTKTLQIIDDNFEEFEQHLEVRQLICKRIISNMYCC